MKNLYQFLGTSTLGMFGVGHLGRAIACGLLDAGFPRQKADRLSSGLGRYTMATRGIGFVRVRRCLQRSCSPLESHPLRSTASELQVPCRLYDACRQSAGLLSGRDSARTHPGDSGRKPTCADHDQLTGYVAAKERNRRDIPCRQHRCA
jgi:hypothetical protein